MNITNIQITSVLEKLTRSWLFRKGSGRLQNVYVISGEFADLDQVSKGITFALLGKKQPDIVEVTVDFIDNSGSTWRLQRGQFAAPVCCLASRIGDQPGQRQRQA